MIQVPEQRIAYNVKKKLKETKQRTPKCLPKEYVNQIMPQPHKWNTISLLQRIISKFTDSLQDIKREK